MQQYQNIKLLLQNAPFLGMKKRLWLKKLSDINGKEIVGMFYEKKFQKAN